MNLNVRNEYWSGVVPATQKRTSRRPYLFVIVLVFVLDRFSCDRYRYGSGYCPHGWVSHQRRLRLRFALYSSGLLSDGRRRSGSTIHSRGPKSDLQFHSHPHQVRTFFLFLGTLIIYSPPCRFVGVLDQLDTRVERFRKEAMHLQEQRDHLLISLDLIKNNDLFANLEERE